MTNTAVARESAWTKLEQVIKGVSTPYSLRLAEGPLEAVGVSTPVFTLTFVGETEKVRTLKNVMVTVQIDLNIFFRLPNSQRDARKLEMDIYHTNRNVQAAIVANSTLGGTVTDLLVGNSSSAVMEAGENPVELRMLTMPVFIDELEAEEISA